MLQPLQPMTHSRVRYKAALVTEFPKRARLKRERTQARRMIRMTQGRPMEISKPMRLSGRMVSW